MERFKDWAVPGPRVPGGPGPEPGETLDALSGFYKIFQYEKGHRFSTDDVLAAWYGTTGAGRAETVLDLGSGIGSVAMIAAWRLPGARFVSVEAQEISHRLATKSLRYNGLENRFEARLGDFRDPEILRPDEKFDLVLTSPPYFPEGTGIPPAHPQKHACRFELRGDVRDYLKTASRHLAPGGVVAGVFPWATRARIWEGATDLTCLKTRPVILRSGEEPLLILFLMALTHDLPADFSRHAFEEPPLLIREANGAIGSEYLRIKLSVGFPP